MLRQAFNSLTRLHSREVQLRRPGTPDNFSPCRVTPANYFRFNRGPEYTDVQGREFIIPTDSMLGHFSQEISFEATPVDGTFQLAYNGNNTTDINWDALASDIQIALRLLAGLQNVLVTGSIAAGLTVTFVGFNTVPLLILPASYGTLVDGSADPVTITVTQDYQVWNMLLKRGDKILDTVFGSMTVEEIIDIPELGGSIMGFRVRCE